jgi:4-hydroxybenzoate polyprenyltransferase
MMTWEVQFLFNIPNRDILCFIFLATVCSYHFHSIINTIYPPTSIRHEWNIRYKSVLIVLFFISLLAVCAYTWQLRKGFFPIAGAVLATFLYSAPNIPIKPFLWLRKIAVGKTIFLALVWTYVTGLLPMLLQNLAPGPRQYLFLSCRFFLVFAICILFDIKDRHEDHLKGIKAWPTEMSDSQIRIIYFLSLSFSLASAVNLFVYGFPAIYIICMIIPIIACMLLYQYALTHTSDLVYYVFLDGMLMLSAVLLSIYLISITFVS